LNKAYRRIAGQRVAILLSIPNKNQEIQMKHKRFTHSLSVLTALAALMCAVAPSQAADKKPNILFIMGDDVGWFNIGAYHRGIMSGNLGRTTSAI
jgi:hypothetical protein